MGIHPLFGIAVLLIAAVSPRSIAANKKTYIVHMEQFDLIRSTLDVEEATYFESSLESVSNTKMLYKYKNVLNGYSVSLTPDEAEALKALPQVLSVSAETIYKLHTTRTPAFLGLDQQHVGLPSPQQVSDIIIGVIDTGVWPESKSYDDTGLGPIPSHWRGECETGRGFNSSMCNKKLVGARFFSQGYEAKFGNKINWTVEYKSPRDSEGHGTHVSTTAAGSVVHNANEFGYAFGTARGMATHARVAMYKCCWIQDCGSSDILAAMDRAIDDNVDVMSVSLGMDDLQPYYSDYVAIGAFAAMEKGIFVACSVGNDGPNISSVVNAAPWMTTVGAGTLDRDFPAPVTLGNGNNYYGVSLYSGKSMGGKFLPLVYAGNATNNSTHGHLCLPGTLNPHRVRGKLVLCDRGTNPRVEKGFVVQAAGGAGMILANVALNGEGLIADAHLYLATAVGERAGNAIKKYLFSNPNPTATITFQGTKIGVQHAPVVAAFSSRGPNYSDAIAIGAFAAMEKGILVSCAVGNEGPTTSTLYNVAPWITTVGAGTLDRDFPATVTLGNGKIYNGVSLYSGKSMDGKFLPLVYAGNATNNRTYGHLCFPGTLNPHKVHGKLVLCDRGTNPRVEKGFVVQAAGGAGMILANVALNGEGLIADAHLYLATAVGERAGNAIKKYLFSGTNPTATISFQGTKLGVQPAPMVAAMSSRGPNLLTPDILKPDLIAPGVNILAAWSGDASPTIIDSDMRRVPFNIISGTSMSCPHVSGLAALVKGVHPNWGPAAIRSALMTTAYSTYEYTGNTLLDAATGKPSTPFAYGAGHVKPIAALNPGLVYDLNATDYFNFLCAINYTEAQIKLLSKRTKFSCKVNKPMYSVSALNYPSFAVIFQADQEGNATEVQHIRTLTNVGPTGTYKARVILPCESPVKIQVVPKTLTFSRANEKKSYKVTFKGKAYMPAGTNLFSRLEWSDGKHVVGSPIAVSWTTPP